MSWRRKQVAFQTACRKSGPQAGHKALHTRTSWYAYAAMSGSSTEIITTTQVCYHTIAFHLYRPVSCQHLSDFIGQHRLSVCISV